MTKTTLQVAASFGRVVPVAGRPGWFRLDAPWVALSGFFRKMDRLGRDFVGPWECDHARSWAVFYPWQK